MSFLHCLLCYRVCWIKSCTLILTHLVMQSCTHPHSPLLIVLQLATRRSLAASISVPAKSKHVRRGVFTLRSLFDQFESPICSNFHTMIMYQRGTFCESISANVDRQLLLHL